MRSYCFSCRAFSESTSLRRAAPACGSCGGRSYRVASAERTDQLAETALPILVRGAAFERQDRERWLSAATIGGIFLPELVLPLGNGHDGRVDVAVHLEGGDDEIVLVELKSTRWDRIAPPRVRPNLLRHVRQLMWYVDAAFNELALFSHPSLTYPNAPPEPLKSEIEALLLSHVTQCVWRDEESR